MYRPVWPGSRSRSSRIARTSSPEASATRLGGLGIESLVFDPCSNVPDEGDFLEVMRSNAGNLAQVFPEPGI